MSAMQNQLQDLMDFMDEDHDGSVDPEVSLTSPPVHSRAHAAHTPVCVARGSCSPWLPPADPL